MRSADRFRPSPAFSVWEGAVVARRRAFDAAGGWPAPFFYAHEGIELAWRVWDAGYTVWYAGDLAVAHPVTATTRHRDFYRLNARNRVWLARRNLPWPCRRGLRRRLDRRPGAPLRPLPRALWCPGSRMVGGLAHGAGPPDAAAVEHDRPHDPVRPAPRHLTGSVAARSIRGVPARAPPVSAHARPDSLLRQSPRPSPRTHARRRARRAGRGRATRRRGSRAADRRVLPRAAAQQPTSWSSGSSRWPRSTSGTASPSSPRTAGRPPGCVRHASAGVLRRLDRDDGGPGAAELTRARAVRRATIRGTSSSCAGRSWPTSTWATGTATRQSRPPTSSRPTTACSSRGRQAADRITETLMWFDPRRLVQHRTASGVRGSRGSGAHRRPGDRALRAHMGGRAEVDVLQLGAEPRRPAGPVTARRRVPRRLPAASPDRRQPPGAGHGRRSGPRAVRDTTGHGQPEHRRDRRAARRGIRRRRRADHGRVVACGRVAPDRPAARGHGACRVGRSPRRFPAARRRPAPHGRGRRHGRAPGDQPTGGRRRGGRPAPDWSSTTSAVRRGRQRRTASWTPATRSCGNGTRREQV